MKSCADLEAWMDDVVDRLAKLTMEQTKVFLKKFVDRCSVCQWRLLEREMQYLLKKDFMTLPQVVIDRILDNLTLESILTMRLVCRSWRDKITAEGTLWRPYCWSQGGSVRDYNIKTVPEDFFFNLFVCLRRLRDGLKNGSTFSIKYVHVADRSSRRVPGFPCGTVAYSNGHFVIGTRSRKILMVDPATQARLWVRRIDSAASLCVSNDLIISASHFGEFFVLSRDGDLLYRKLATCNSVTAVDVHASGRFLLLCNKSGIVHLYDNELSDLQVVHCLQAVHQETSGKNISVKKAFFLPDEDLDQGLLALCVCTNWSVTVAVVTETGSLLQLEDHIALYEMVSFCRCSFDPQILYASEKYDQKLKVRIVKFLIQCNSMSGYSLVMRRLKVRQEEQCCRVADSDMLLLAAGRRFIIWAVSYHLCIFDLVEYRTITVVYNFFGRLTASRIMHEQTQHALEIVDRTWLDGLSPASTQGEKPLLCFATTNSRSNPILKMLYWSTEHQWDSVTSQGPGDGSEACGRKDDSCLPADPDRAEIEEVDSAGSDLLCSPSGKTVEREEVDSAGSDLLCSPSGKTAEREVDSAGSDLLCSPSGKTEREEVGSDLLCSPSGKTAESEEVDSAGSDLLCSPSGKTAEREEVGSDLLCSPSGKTAEREEVDSAGSDLLCSLSGKTAEREEVGSDLLCSPSGKTAESEEVDSAGSDLLCSPSGKTAEREVDSAGSDLLCSPSGKTAEREEVDSAGSDLLCSPSGKTAESEEVDSAGSDLLCSPSGKTAESEGRVGIWKNAALFKERVDKLRLECLSNKSEVFLIADFDAE